jgi:acetoin utilization deacetylase AcuC-like enzyme
MAKTKRTGYVYEELYLWHHAGTISFDKWVEPGEIWENPDTKRRFHSLLAVSGLLHKLHPIRARAATKQEILRYHTEEYHDKIEVESKGTGGDGGEQCRFATGGYEIAALSVGGVLAAVSILHMYARVYVCMDVSW